MAAPSRRNNHRRQVADPRKVAAIVLPRSAVPTVMQELRGSHGHMREPWRH